MHLAHPGQKWLFAAAALLPMSLQLAGSLSADAAVLGVVFCYTALCFALRHRAATHGQLLLLLLLAACTGPAKAIYLPVVLLCLLVPAENLDWRAGPYAAPLRVGPVRVRGGTLVKLLVLAVAGFCWVQANLSALLYATRDVDSVGLTRAAVALATAAVVLGIVYYKVRSRPLGRRIFLGVLAAGVVIAVPVGFYLLTHMWGGLTPEDLVGSIQPQRRFHLHLLGGVYLPQFGGPPSSCCCGLCRSRGRFGWRACWAPPWANPSSTGWRSAGCWALLCCWLWLPLRCLPRAPPACRNFPAGDGWAPR